MFLHLVICLDSKTKGNVNRVGKRSSSLFPQLSGWKDREAEAAVQWRWGCCGTNVSMLQRREVQARTVSIGLRAAAPGLRILLQAGSMESLADCSHLNVVVVVFFVFFFHSLRCVSANLVFGGSFGLRLFKPTDFNIIQSWWQGVIAISALLSSDVKILYSLLQSYSYANHIRTEISIL
mgnify:CR=1 FL=1